MLNGVVGSPIPGHRYGEFPAVMRGLVELILRDGLGTFLGRAVPKRPVRPTLVILMPPGLDPVVSVLQGLEPVRIQALPS